MNQEFSYKNNIIKINKEEIECYEKDKGYIKIKTSEIKNVNVKLYFSPKFFIAFSFGTFNDSPDFEMGCFLVVLLTILFIISSPILVLLTIINKNNIEITTGNKKYKILVKFKDKEEINDIITKLIEKNQKNITIEEEKENIEEEKKKNEKNIKISKMFIMIGFIIFIILMFAFMFYYFYNEIKAL